MSQYGIAGILLGVLALHGRGMVGAPGTDESPPNVALKHSGHVGRAVVVECIDRKFPGQNETPLYGLSAIANRRR
jgi:hypothetical protein